MEGLVEFLIRSIETKHFLHLLNTRVPHLFFSLIVSMAGNFPIDFLILVLMLKLRFKFKRKIRRVNITLLIFSLKFKSYLGSLPLRLGKNQF